MKLKVTIIEEMEVEIAFPAYYRHGSALYKIFDENTWIKVGGCDALGEESLILLFSNKPSYGDNVLAKGVVITEEEFEAAFDKNFEAISRHSKVLA